MEKLQWYEEERTTHVANGCIGYRLLFDRLNVNSTLELNKYDQLYATISWHPAEAGTFRGNGVLL